MKLLQLILILFASISNADSLTVSPVGLTLHGTEVSNNLTKDMPRKLDKSGVFIWHPEVSLIYKSKSMQYNALYLRDCVDNPAFMVGLGPYWKINKKASYGFIGGVYGRKEYKKVVVKKTETEIATTTYTLPPMGPLSYKNKGWEYVPMAMGTLSYKIPISKKNSFEFNLGSNIVITHLTVGFSFSGL